MKLLAALVLCFSFSSVANAEVPWRIKAVAIDTLHALNTVNIKDSCAKLSNFLGQAYAFGNLFSVVAKSNPKIYSIDLAIKARRLGERSLNARNAVSNQDLCEKAYYERVVDAQNLITEIVELINYLFSKSDSCLSIPFKALLFGGGISLI